MRRPVDWGLYLVTDRQLAGPRPVEDLVRAAVRGGVTVVQLREKNLCAREYVELARRLKIFLADTGVPLIVNDRVDVALAARADGVHLGQSDMDPRDARRLLGPEAIIGLSVETMEQAASLDVDYLGVSPIFSTPTKPELTGGWGIEGLAGLRALSRHALVAIGGISAANAAEVIRAGADGVAVVSAICAAPDPEAAARELLRIVKGARG